MESIPQENGFELVEKLYESAKKSDKAARKLYAVSSRPDLASEILRLSVEASADTRVLCRDIADMLKTGRL